MMSSAKLRFPRNVANTQIKKKKFKHSINFQKSDALVNRRPLSDLASKSDDSEDAWCDPGPFTALTNVSAATGRTQTMFAVEYIG